MDKEMMFNDLIDVYKKENPDIALEIEAAMMEVDIRTELFVRLIKKGISTKQISKISRIKKSRIKNLRSMDMTLTFEEIAKIAAALGMKLVLADMYGKENSNDRMDKR